MHSKELREQANALRAQGMLMKEIAEQLGVPKSTVTRWTNKKLMKRERIKAKRRKFSRDLHCPKCKKPMSNTSTKCSACYKASQRYWTRERIITAMQEWALREGRQPTIADWERSGPDHPAWSSIRDGPNPVFGSWNEAIAEAGFVVGKRRRRKKLSVNERQVRKEVRRKIRENRIKAAVEKGEHDGYAAGVRDDAGVPDPAGGDPGGTVDS